LRNEAKAITDSSKGKGMLFMHIPMVEYMEIVNNLEYYGVKGEGIACWSVNTGLYSVLLEEGSPVNWITCGHDHDNDFFSDFNGITIGYGRKSGFGSYGPSWRLPGSSVFEITLDSKGDTSIKSWIRQSDGSKFEYT